VAADGADLERRSEQLRLGEARARATGDLRAAASSGAVLDEVTNELNTLRYRQERLVVRAPIDGVVVGYRLAERVGEALKEGDLLLELDSVDGRTARVRVPIKEAGRIASGQRAGLKISTWPGTKWVSTVTTVAPAAQQGWVEAVVPFPQSDRMPLIGMNGTAKIVTDRGSVGELVVRKLRHTVRLDLWL
jgi:multidrug resistance efflux pump